MATISVAVVDAALNEVDRARVTIEAPAGMLATEREGSRWRAQASLGGRAAIVAEADGFASERHSIAPRQPVTQVVVGLRKPGDLVYTYGDSKFAFAPSHGAMLLRVRGRGAANALEGAMRARGMPSRSVLWRREGPPDHAFSRVAGASEAIEEIARELRASGLLVDVALPIEHGDHPVLGLTSDLIVAFRGGVPTAMRNRICETAGVSIVRDIRHAGNAVLATVDAGLSYDILRIADSLVQGDQVAYVEPRLLFTTRPDAYVPNDPLWPQVPYLQLINADGAWQRLGNVTPALRGGSPDVTIAIIDDEGVTPDHPELTAQLTDGTAKLVSTTNFATVPIAAQTVAGLGGTHGTKCAGSASAAFDDSRGLPGVAPNCHVIGAYVLQAIDALEMADVYLWVAGFLNGSPVAGFPAAPPARPADVISSSWGPASPLALSNVLRDCFDFLTCYGRGGKGCVLCFSIGNFGYVPFTDPTLTGYRAWASYEKTLAIGASISVDPTNPIAASGFPDPAGNTVNLAAAVDTRALYSPYGATSLRKPDLVAPSNTTWNPANVAIDPILAAVPVGRGQVNGCTVAAPCNDYVFDFGGTSHAAPVVAGAAALMLSARPELNWIQVRDILRQSSARIDAAQANAVGAWQDLDGDGNIDYSRWYGAGRLDVDAAIALCLDAQRGSADVCVRDNMADTGDVPSTGTWWESPDIWVRRDSTEPIPALAWTDPAPHQNPRRGQDNAVFCRVRNRGTAPASAVYVRALIAHWPGLEFAYPGDFEPSNAGGLLLGAMPATPLTGGTYLIGETRIDGLAAGADQIVKFVWDQTLIPPETFVYNGNTVAWHPCLLLEASPHDGPQPVAGPVPVEGDNNIAQRNVHILNPGERDARWVAVLAGTRHRDGVDSVVVDTTGIEGNAIVHLHVAEPSAMRRWMAERRVATEEDKAGFPAIEIDRRPMRARLPLPLAADRFVLLLISVAGECSGDLTITQQRGDRTFSAGYGIRIAADAR